MSALLEVRDVRKNYGGLAAVDGASFDVEGGSVTALIGPNGAGKTTLFNIVSGFVAPEGGEITFGGSRIEGRPAHRIARKGLVRTFQTAKALARMSVLDNMLLAAPNQPGERLWRVLIRPRLVRAHERQNVQRARELLAFVRLDALADDYAGTLSGGQRKLLEFARALMTEPEMLLLDEPLAGVNPALGEQLLTHVFELRADRGMTFLIVEHDVEKVMTLCDAVIVMDAGSVIASGPPALVRDDPAVLDAYLGAPVPRLDGD